MALFFFAKRVKNIAVNEEDERMSYQINGGV